MFVLFRFVAFEEKHYDRSLSNGTIVGEIKVNSQSECCQKCVAIPACKSVNICYGENCQLNEADRFRNGTKLEVQKNCVYVGMKREFVPRCREKGANKEITNDLNPGF